MRRELEVVAAQRAQGQAGVRPSVFAALETTKDLVTVRLHHQRIELPAATWAWTKKKRSTVC